MSPEGLVSMGRRNLGKLAVVYLLFAGIGLAVPALIASSHPRGDSPHPTLDTNRR